LHAHSAYACWVEPPKPNGPQISHTFEIESSERILEAHGIVTKINGILQYAFNQTSKITAAANSSFIHDLMAVYNGQPW
jgi:hypothetical protein